MYEWLSELISEAKNEFYISFSANAASEEEILEVEERLGVALPDSYKAFLRKWNGGELRGSRILSTQELLDYAEEWGFRPFENEVELSDERQRHYYASKPAHHLIFRSFDLASEVYCLDTRMLANGEYPICLYDADRELKENMTVIYPSFEAMLIYDILADVVVEPEFLIDSNGQNGNDFAVLELHCTKWQIKLKEMLMAKGAVFTENDSIFWESWR